MLAALTADDIFARILMLRTVENRTILLVEGESDCAVLDSHLDQMRADTLPTGSKGVAIAVAELAFVRAIEAVVALVDRDWVGTIETKSTSDNVFYTDAYDMDTTIVSIPDVATRVLDAFCKRDALRAVADPSGGPVAIAAAAAAAVSSLRFESISRSWGLSVRDFPVHVIVDLTGAEPDLDKLCHIALSRSASAFQVSDILPVVRSSFAFFKSRLADCSGHDLVGALSFVINQSYGGSVSANNLASALRSAVSCADLKGTTFWRVMNRWAADRSVGLWSC